jgi:hypothetical protein
VCWTLAFHGLRQLGLLTSLPVFYPHSTPVFKNPQRQRAKGRPYVVVFCGVNGVGKSTNLAKIAYWLGQHGLKVQLAACDTFRAGAVEQLKTHAMRLGVSGGGAGAGAGAGGVVLDWGLLWGRRIGMGCSVVLRVHSPTPTTDTSDRPTSPSKYKQTQTNQTN